MQQFSIDSAQAKPALYATVVQQLRSLVAGERDLRVLDGEIAQIDRVADSQEADDQ